MHESIMTKLHLKVIIFNFVSIICKYLNIINDYND